jgi:hypothetical protein
LNPIQFNAFAIVFLLGFMPFAVAFITNIGSDSEGPYLESTRSDTPWVNANYWLENGGSNYTDHYNLTNPPNYYPYYTDCVYVSDGYCRGFFDYQQLSFVQATVPSWDMPMTSSRILQSHFWGNTYLGTSGDGPFAWYLSPDFFDNIDKEDSIDKLKFTFSSDDSVDYSCSNTIFQNITFDYEITFIDNGKRKTFTDFSYEGDNKYPLTYYDNQNGHWVDTCRVGFEVIFDFTGFESLNLYDFNNGNFSNTSVELRLDNFKLNGDEPIGYTALPFAGNTYFFLGIEHQPINPVQAGFIIRTGTLFLSLGTFLFAVASTPYYDPVRGFLKGAIE